MGLVWAYYNGTISRLVNIVVAIIADKLSPPLSDYRQCYRRYFWKEVLIKYRRYFFGLKFQ